MLVVLFMQEKRLEKVQTWEGEGKGLTVREDPISLKEEEPEEKEAGEGEQQRRRHAEKRPLETTQTAEASPARVLSMISSLEE